MNEVLSSALAGDPAAAAGTKIVNMQVAPQGAPSTIMLEYRGPDNVYAQFTLANASIVNAAKVGSGSTQPQVGHVDSWRIGDEVVIVPKHMLSAGAIERIKGAMSKSSPAISAADARSRLLPFIALPRRIAQRDPFVDDRVQSHRNRRERYEGDRVDVTSARNAAMPMRRALPS